MTLESLYDHTEWEEPPVRGRRRRPLVVALVLLALLILYVVVAVWFGGRVPGGTTVAGVAVGGMSRDEARTTLTASLGERAAQPLVLASPAGEVETSAKALGLGVDVDASLDGLVGFSLSPVAMWHHLVGGADEPAAVTVDEAAFGAALDKARAELDAEPVEGSISVAKGTVSLTEPVTGTRTDVEGTAEAVRRWWPSESRVDVVASRLEPVVSAAELARVRNEFADRAVSAPVTVSAGGKSFELTPAQFGPAVVLTADDSGRITPRPDEKKLTEIVHAAARKSGAEVAAKDAVVTFSGRTPSVAPHVSGVALDDASVRTEVWKAIGSADRTATVVTRASEPTFTTARAKATLPKEQISSFTTYYKAGQPRVSNIKLASRVINGTYVPPGEQFSMNAVLGQRTAAKGYIEAGIIRDGRAAESLGGGISQVSTTIFNAAFFSGMRLDAWTPHYYYISRYPEGREATISWPDLHNKFTNVTDGGVLIQVRATDTQVTVSFYGTKKYDVTATKSARRDITQPKKIVDDSPTCIPQAPVVGFTVDVGRILKQGGKVVKTEKYTTTYRPEDDVTCTNPDRS